MNTRTRWLALLMVAASPLWGPPALLWLIAALCVALYLAVGLGIDCCARKINGLGRRVW